MSRFAAHQVFRGEYVQIGHIRQSALGTVYGLHPERFTKGRPWCVCPRSKSVTILCRQMLSRPPARKESTSQPYDESLRKHVICLASGSFKVDTFRRSPVHSEPSPNFSEGLLLSYDSPKTVPTITRPESMERFKNRSKSRF